MASGATISPLPALLLSARPCVCVAAIFLFFYFFFCLLFSGPAVPDFSVAVGPSRPSFPGPSRLSSLISDGHPNGWFTQRSPIEAKHVDRARLKGTSGEYFTTREFYWQMDQEAGTFWSEGLALGK